MPWQAILARVLRPARPELSRCLAARDAHVARRAAVDDARSRAVAECVQRIRALRSDVFSAGDGFVPVEMTDLEREYRALARLEADRGLMDLWAEIAPPSWIDRKRWRDTPSSLHLDAAVALAADPSGVEAAEAAVEAWRAALAAHGVAIAPGTRWRLSAEDDETAGALLAAPLERARAEAALHGAGARVMARAEALAAAVLAAARSRWPSRPGLARDLAVAARLDVLWSAMQHHGLPDPVQPLRALWETGYVIASVDANGVTLAAPAL